MEILAVMVRYKTPIEESQTFRSLMEQFRRYPDLNERVGVVVWDNSPVPLKNPSIISPFIYRKSETNIGVSGAYNRATKLAKEFECRWQLLLDQDTFLMPDYLLRMLDYGLAMQGLRKIAAVVPILADGKQVISPGILRGVRTLPVASSVHGVQKELVIPFNSGSLLRVDDLTQIGGFNEDFWLDYSDYVVFDLLQTSGKQVYIAGDLLIQHKLSISDFDSDVSTQRYANFLYAEGSYWDQYRPGTLSYLHTLRLLVRGILQFFRHKNKIFSQMTFVYFAKRLLWSRSWRLREWKRISAIRNQPSPRDSNIVY